MPGTGSTANGLDPFPIDNVAVHASLLPAGKILCWGRRTNPMSMVDGTMDEQKTVPFLIDLTTTEKMPRATCTYTKKRPKLTGGEDVNLFCSVHCFRPDGSLFVAGGHISDGVGANQACVYDPFNDIWTAIPAMNNGRWYPSALTLPDSSVFVISGSMNKAYDVDNIPQVWRNGAWVEVSSPLLVSALYPRLHLAPDGSIFTAGPLAKSQYLALDGFPPTDKASTTVGAWAPDDPKQKIQLPKRIAGERQYGSSAVYEPGKIIWTGGGNQPVMDNDDNVIMVDNEPTGPPTKVAEIIDLNDKSDKGPQWRHTSPMLYPRRQHNATTLPDGTVLVTGGTKGPGFNNVDDGMPVHVAELWNPADGKWTEMAAENSDRCYHGNAVLLPTGEVLSLGSGEGGVDPAKWNPPRNNLTNAQKFRPPYLFKGNRPTVISPPPNEVKYGQDITVTVADTDSIAQLSWIRLGSVTHGMNMNQSVWYQKFEPAESKSFTAQAPDNRYTAPPGHYMVFFMNTQGVPSMATIVKILPEETSKETTPKRSAAAAAAVSAAATKQVAISNTDLNKTIIAEQDRHAVAVGLTPVCPYGLGPCWGGASEGLQSISDISIVRPVPDQANSLAYVYLKDDNVLPDIDLWRNEFAKTVNGSYSK